MADHMTIKNAAVTRRNPWAVFGLGLITLGIYTLWWYYEINREMRDLGADVRPGVSLIAILFGGLIIVPPFVSVWHTATRIRDTQVRMGAEGTMSHGWGLVLWIFLGIFAPVYYQSQINRAWNAAPAADKTVSVAA